MLAKLEDEGKINVNFVGDCGHFILSPQTMAKVLENELSYEGQIELRKAVRSYFQKLGAELYDPEE